jgi:putative endonuclease
VNREHRYFVYILASKRNGTLYVGVTSNLAGRIHDHKEDLREGFTKKYGVHLLVWFEEFSDVNDAILREKRIKKWRRAWKLELIEKTNPEWVDLFPQIV